MIAPTNHFQTVFLNDFRPFLTNIRRLRIFKGSVNECIEVNFGVLLLLAVHRYLWTGCNFV